MPEEISLPETLHLVTQRGQPAGSVRKCCEVCGRMCWSGQAGSAKRWTDDPDAWAAASDRCGLADVASYKRTQPHRHVLPRKPVCVPGIGSVWEHYKGDRYRVVSTSRHTEDPRCWLVSYRPLAGGDDWTRAMMANPQWPAGFLDTFGPDDARGHRFRLISGPRTWMEEAQPDPDLERFLAGAQRHGAESDEPEHEVGDLQDMLRAAWALMSPEQRAEWERSAAAEAMREWAGFL